jgi:inhibitor of cysteine peptidase
MNNTKMFIASFLAALLIISSVPLYLYLNTPEISDQVALNKFSSYEELKTFIENASSSSKNYWLRGGELGSENFDTQAAAPKATETADTDYSTTNIQVEGVDEADIVKTDGEYVYIVSGGNLSIVKAYPPGEARVVSKISLTGGIAGIFVNGDKLAVFETEYGIYPLYEGEIVYDVSTSSEEVNEPADEPAVDDETAIAPPPTNKSAPDDENRTSPSIPERGNESIPEEPSKVPESIVYEPPTTSIKVYDISDRGNPVLKRNFSVDGNYFSSRMIGDYVYVVATQWAVFIETDVFLPRVHSDNETEVIPPDDIYYYNFSDSSYSFTSIIALNIKNDAQAPTHETILLGATSTIYVSQNNIYLTFPNYTWQENETMKTSIQRIKIDKQAITFAAQGEVPGYVLNQFSMDEHNGYFRIATTIYNYNTWRTFTEETTAEEAKDQNNVYVLDMNLNFVGKLEDLAPGEQIYSARFMGDRLYLVTFRNIDPLFVIDLSNPTAPKVLGQLKVTGYSGYLHPYDENHIIGIGKETEYDAEEDFSWYQGVKISLFDVSDVSNPVEVSKYEIGDRGTQSPVLNDHKALLFDKEKNLLVIPVLVAEMDLSKYKEEVPDWAYGEYVWQGAYVLDISLDVLELRGRITHMDDNADLLKRGYYFGSYYSVQRSLYIENVLYTISGMKVKMNNLETLAEINTVDIS